MTERQVLDSFDSPPVKPTADVEGLLGVTAPVPSRLTRSTTRGEQPTDGGGDGGREVEAASSFVKLPNGTVWPNPEDPRDIAWALREGQPTRSHMVIAASFMHAYRDLIWRSRDDRQAVVASLRAALLAEQPGGGR